MVACTSTQRVHPNGCLLVLSVKRYSIVKLLLLTLINVGMCHCVSWTPAPDRVLGVPACRPKPYLDQGLSQRLYSCPGPSSCC